MSRRRLHGPHLIAAFLAGLAAFNYPLVALFDRLGWIAGWPAQYVWLMVCWLAVIVLLGLASGAGRRSEGETRR